MTDGADQRPIPKPKRRVAFLQRPIPKPKRRGAFPQRPIPKPKRRVSFLQRPIPKPKRRGAFPQRPIYLIQDDGGFEKGDQPQFRISFSNGTSAAQIPADLLAMKTQT